MKPSSVCLPKSEIPLLLSGDMPPDEAAAAESHIAECESCRSTIESMIADSRWWDDARKSLVASKIHVAASLRDAEDCRVEDGSAKYVDADAASLGETRLRGTGLHAKLLDLLGPTDDPNMLGRIGPYEVIGLLGQGGMGAVFKGFDRSLNRFVAIKMLLPHLAASGAARKRFAREGQAVAAVVDDHVMAIHCVDEWQGVPYLVMTYSRGVSLQKRLSDNGPLEVREILRIGMQAAKGLAAAHAQGIVHRDIKPANIFLDQNVERVQLMDFGLARAVDDASLTRSGTLAGTPQYMSPEQARAETVDHRSDLFSLGSVMYAMCTGHAPFRAESSYSVLRLITDKEPRPIREINPDIPEWLCTIIGKLMAKQADERFGSAKEVAEVLEECLAHVQRPQAMPLPEKVISLAPKMVRRPPVRKFIGAAAFTFSLLFAGVLVVLELNKGTLTIESDAEDVPIRIMQGEKIVERMTVTKAGNSVRVAAGNYMVELDDTIDNMIVENDKVVLSRGATERIKIRYSPTKDRAQSHDASTGMPGTSAPVFDTPEALMKYVADCQNREDVAGYLSCLTDEPVKKLASGYLLNVITMLQDFQNNPKMGRPPKYAERINALEQLVREALSDLESAPSALALSTESGELLTENESYEIHEWATRSMQSPLVQLLASITVDRIKDPRKFIVGVDALELEDARAKAKKDRKEYDYKVKQNGDKAVATNLIDGVKTSLVKTAKGWLIDDPWYGIAIRDELGTIDVPPDSKNILVRKLHSKFPNSWAYRVYLPTETPYQIEFYQNTGAKLVFNDGKDSIEPMSVDPGQFTIGIGVAESLVKPNDISVESFGVFIDGRSNAINFQRSDIKFFETKLGAYVNFGFHLTDFPHHNEDVESFAPGDSITLLHVKDPSNPARLIDGKPAEIIIRLIPRRTDSAEPKGVRPPIDPTKTDDIAENKKLAPSPPVFDTPEALMKYVADCQNRDDVAGYLSCLTDEPVKQLASGYFLASISMLQEFANDPNTHRPPNYAERMKELEQVVREAVSDKDVAPSALAFATAGGQMRLESKSHSFEESATRMMQDPLLHLLANITVDRIKDPRRFIVRFNAIVIEDERSKAERGHKEFDYLVEQDGDKAVATNKSDGNKTGLIKTAKSWRINDPWYGIKTKDDLGAVLGASMNITADGFTKLRGDWIVDTLCVGKGNGEVDDSRHDINVYADTIEFMRHVGSSQEYGDQWSADGKLVVRSGVDGKLMRLQCEPYIRSDHPGIFGPLISDDSRSTLQVTYSLEDDKLRMAIGVDPPALAPTDSPVRYEGGIEPKEHIIYVEAHRRAAKLPDNQPNQRIKNSQSTKLDPQSLEFATKSFNEQTAELRRSLFQPPIPDLSIEQMREGLGKAVDDYRRGGKHQVANALQKIAETGRLPDGILLFVTGVHAEDDRGETLTRQIVPGLILPDNTANGGNLLTPIQPLELLYRKDGKCSKTYGDSDWDLQPRIEKPVIDSLPNEQISDLLRKLEGRWTIDSIYAPQSGKDVKPSNADQDVYVFEKNKVAIERDGKPTKSGSVELKSNSGLTLTMRFENKDDPSGKSDSHLEGPFEFKSKDEFWLAVPDMSARSQEAVFVGQPRVVWKLRRVNPSAPAPTREFDNLVKHFDRESSVNVVAVAPDGKTMAIGSRESSEPTSWPTVSIIDIGTGNTMRTILPASEEERKMIEQSKWISALNIAALAYSPDGKKLAIGTSFGQVDIVNPETGERILTLSDNLNGETVSRTKRIHPYPDRGPNDDAARALARLKELRRAMGNVASIAFTSDGLWLATSGGSFEDQPLEFDFTGQAPASKTGPGRVKVWNVETGKRKYNFDHHLHAESIAFSGNARSRNEYFDCLLATAGIWGTGDKRFSGVRLWRMGDGNLVQELRNEDEDLPNSIAYSRDSVHLAIGLKHKTNANGETCGIVRLVKPLAGDVWKKEVPVSARKVMFVANGNMLAVLCGQQGLEESIQLLDANTGKLKRELKLADLSHGGAWLDLAYSASEELLIAVGCDKEQRGSIDVWDFENRRGEASKVVVLEPIGSFQGHWTTKQGYWIACHYPTSLDKADKEDPGSLVVRLGIVHGGPLHPGPSAVSAEDLQIISQMWLVVRDGDRVISRARIDRELDHGNEEHYIAIVNATDDLVPKMEIEFDERRKSGTQRFRIPLSAFIKKP